MISVAEPNKISATLVHRQFNDQGIVFYRFILFQFIVFTACVYIMTFLYDHPIPSARISFNADSSFPF